MKKEPVSTSKQFTPKDFAVLIFIVLGVSIVKDMVFQSVDTLPATEIVSYNDDIIPKKTAAGPSIDDARPWDRNNPLGIPPGQAENLPSIRVAEKQESADSKRKIYGGKGDKKHLGGFTELDLNGVSPTLWKYMITNLGVHSFMDVGCGRGTSTSWFYLHGCDVLCAEGSHDAVENSMLPDVANQVVEHDFSRGPWWPAKTYDAVWSVEFLEHVGVQYHFNYITAFRKAALIFVTSSRWGGWHHVEVHLDDWWIQKYESYGFRYDAKLTEKVRAIASEEQNNDVLAPNGAKYNPQHIWLSMKVFINPAVASLPEHAHLFPEHGCYGGRNSTHVINRVCGTGNDEQKDVETPLPKELWPIELKPEMDDAWYELVRKNIKTAR
jgi:Methyltransferase domain